MKIKIKEIFKYNKLSIILSIITLLIGILVYMTLLLMAKDKMINDGINIIKSKMKL